MDQDGQLDFQLKIHAFERSISGKLKQMQVLEKKFETIAAIKIDSQDQILMIVSEIKLAIKQVKLTLSVLKNQCLELKITSLYQIFKSLCTIMISAVKILADSCQSGIQRNMLHFNSHQNKLLTYTKATFQRQIQPEKEQQQQKIQTKEQAKIDFRSDFEFHQLYESILIHKESVSKTSASSAVPKLNQVCMSWMKIVDNSDRMLEEAFYRKNQKLGQATLNKPDYISKVLKEQLSKKMQTFFGESINIVLKRLYSQIYHKQYQKMKEQIEGKTPVTKQSQQQTDMQGYAKLKQIIRQKRVVQKYERQIQRINLEKAELAEQYFKASKNNQAYVSRIKDLQLKLLKLMPLTIWQNKQFYRSYFKYNADSSNTQPFQNQIQILQDLHRQSSMTTSIQNKLAQKYQLQQKLTEKQLNKTPQIQIIKKNRKIKRIYPKSRLKTDHGTQKTKKQQHSQILSSTKDMQNRKQSFDRGIQKLRRLSTQILLDKEKPFKFVEQHEYRQTMTKILDIVQKIKSQTYMPHKIISSNNENRTNTQENRKITDQKQITEKQKQEQKQKQKAKYDNYLLSKKIIQSTQMVDVFQNFAAKCMQNNIMRCQQKIKTFKLRQKQQIQRSKQKNQEILKSLTSRQIFRPSKKLTLQKSPQQQKTIANNVLKRLIKPKKKQSIELALERTQRQGGTQYSAEIKNTKQTIYSQINKQSTNQNKVSQIKQLPEVSNQQSIKSTNTQHNQSDKALQQQKMQQFPKRKNIINKKMAKKESKVFQRLFTSQQKSFPAQNKFRQTTNTLPTCYTNQQKLNSLIQKITKAPKNKSQNSANNQTLINVSQMILQDYQDIKKKQIINNIVDMCKKYRDNQQQLEVKVSYYVEQVLDKFKKQKKKYYLRNTCN